MRRALALLASAVGLVAVAGCGIRTDAAPRDIAGDRQEQLSEVGRGDSDTPAGGSRVYLVDAGSPVGLLRAVARDVPQEPEHLMSALLAGPSDTERTGRLRTAIPAATELLGVRYDGPALVTVDLSNGILDATGDTLVDAVAQIVYTLSEIDTITSVQLRVEGQSRQWPIGDGTLTGAPLTVYQYPGLAASAQPDYPALPSATAPSTTAT